MPVDEESSWPLRQVGTRLCWAATGPERNTSPLRLGYVFSTSALGWHSKLACPKHPGPQSLAQACTQAAGTCI